MIEVIVAVIGLIGLVMVAMINFYGTRSTRRAVEEVRGEVTRNGGGSLKDVAVDARDTAAEAVAVAKHAARAAERAAEAAVESAKDAKEFTLLNGYTLLRLEKEQKNHTDWMERADAAMDRRRDKLGVVEEKLDALGSVIGRHVADDQAHRPLEGTIRARV